MEFLSNVKDVRDYVKLIVNGGEVSLVKFNNLINGSINKYKDITNYEKNSKTQKSSANNKNKEANIQTNNIKIITSGNSTQISAGNTDNKMTSRKNTFLVKEEKKTDTNKDKAKNKSFKECPTTVKHTNYNEVTVTI